MLGYQIYLYHNPQLRIDYTLYKPKILPDGLHTEKEYISLYTAHPLLWFAPYDLKVGVDLSGDWSYIAQSRTKGELSSPCAPNVVGLECYQGKTKAGQEYLQVLSYNSDEKQTPFTYDIFSHQTIAFEKGGTRISIQVYPKNGLPIPADQISAMIDSFEPYTPKNLEVRRYHPGP